MWGVIVGAVLAVLAALGAALAALVSERDKRKGLEKDAAAHRQRDAIEDKLAVRDQAAEALRMKRVEEAKAAAAKRKKEIIHSWTEANGEDMTDTRLEALLKQADARAKELEDEGDDS